ncbi:hypothetical protein N0V90_002518 [Kalmusia sp. IMI 367209]|nr:hypothetical protein N0V90_002518 [Kalmusia sp. IMI 367209]
MLVLRRVLSLGLPLAVESGCAAADELDDAISDDAAAGVLEAAGTDDPTAEDEMTMTGGGESELVGSPAEIDEAGASLATGVVDGNSGCDDSRVSVGIGGSDAASEDEASGEDSDAAGELGVAEEG